jgi:O-antigen/teichoic acid export membrane protein
LTSGEDQEGQGERQQSARVRRDTSRVEPKRASLKHPTHISNRCPAGLQRSDRGCHTVSRVAADDATPPDGAMRRLLSRGLVRAGIVTYVFSTLSLIANLVTGIVTARALGPDGRGIAVALVTVTQLAGFLFAMGVAQSLSYFIARRPQDGPTLLLTWVLMLAPLTAVAIGLTQVLLPTIFAGDGAQAIDIGRWFMFTIVLVVGLELTYGLLLGIHDYFVYNLLRFAQPALLAVSYVVLWWRDELTVEVALITATAATALAMGIALVRAVQRIGVRRPDLRLGLTTLWYGARGQGSTVAANVTARLDVAMLPAFVTASSVGLYSVATNVSLIVYQLANTFAGLVLPAAARDPERGPVKVIGSLWASLAVAAALAAGLALLARPLLGLVYGDDFRDAAEPLLLILPGAVLFAGASILNAGVYAAGRPFTSTATQIAGMLVTIVGLSVFLRTGGITAAALVSTASYTTVFLASLLAYQRVAGIPWSQFVPTPARLRAVAR